MNDNVFSWQKKDFQLLVQSYQQRVFFLHSKDIASPYHVFTSFSGYLNDQGHSLFIVSKNDTDHINPLLPFLRAANDMPFKIGSGLGTGMIKSIIKDITQSDTLAQIAENISRSDKRPSLFLNEREHNLITHFSIAAGGCPPVFVFWGFPNYDSHSKNLTDLLVSGQLDCDFPFLSNAKYIFLCETEDNISLYRNLKINEHIDISISEHTVMDMEEILSEIAPTLKLKDSEVEKLFYLTGGRLSIIEILARYLTENDFIMQTSAPQDAVNLILADRLERMGEQGNDVKTVLETAAAIGDVFYIPLLKKAVKRSDICDQILDKCDKEFFTTCNEDVGKFKYNEIREYFYRYIPDNCMKVTASLIADAIYFFNPYDYIARAHHLERASKKQEACELYIFAYNTSFQEGIVPSEELATKIKCLSYACRLTDYWSMLEEYYAQTKRLDFEKGLEILENMPIIISPRLLLLKEYLIGLCTHRASDSAENQQNAFLSIEKASEFAEGVEDGIWCDCQMILISFSVNFRGDIALARAISKKLSYFYTQKIYAPYAQKGLHALERKHSALYSVEKAVFKTQHSVEFFRNKVYPAQYIMALNNHAANLTVLGRFSEAMEYLTEASIFLQRNICNGVNLIYLLNNYCLCSVLLGKLSPHDACQKIKPLLKREPFGDWKIITTINYAIYLAQDGKLDEAESELQLLKKLSEDLDDDYYLYYVYANLAAIYYLQGNANSAFSTLESKCMQPPTLFKETEKIYFKERTKKWMEIIKTEYISDPKIYDAYLLSLHPAKTQWSFIGRGFLYSDIQFWSEP